MLPSCCLCHCCVAGAPAGRAAAATTAAHQQLQHGVCETSEDFGSAAVLHSQGVVHVLVVAASMVKPALLDSSVEELVRFCPDHYAP
jgi:hypothetical protein